MPRMHFTFQPTGLIVASLIGLAVANSGTTANAQSSTTAQPPMQMAPGLMMPAMNPQRGKMLFASEGCVVCHSVNGVGGEDAPPLDSSTMEPMMNPFEFFAQMWRGAEGMIAMQQSELGEQIEFTGQDLADIVAFAHNQEVQKTFTEDDIPPEIRKKMEGGGSEGMGQDMMNGSSPGSTGEGMQDMMTPPSSN